MALREQWLPPQAIFGTPDPACKFPIVTESRDAASTLVLTNSFGFGGVNAALISGGGSEYTGIMHQHFDLLKSLIQPLLEQSLSPDGEEKAAGGI